MDFNGLLWEKSVLFVHANPECGVKNTTSPVDLLWKKNRNDKKRDVVKKTRPIVQRQIVVLRTDNDLLLSLRLRRKMSLHFLIPPRCQELNEIYRCHTNKLTFNSLGVLKTLPKDAGVCEDTSGEPPDWTGPGKSVTRKVLLWANKQLKQQQRAAECGIILPAII